MSDQKNQPNTNEIRHSYDDEIDLVRLFSIVWKGKWVIIAVTLVFAIASVSIALYLPDEYKASAVVQPNESGGAGKLSSLAGQFGGIASLAGIKLGANESSDAVIAMEVMQSWGFAEEFIDRHELVVPLFGAQNWEQSTNTLRLDEDLYDSQKGLWVRQAPKGKTVHPTSWELYQALKERVRVEQNAETGLVTVSVIHYSPYIAKKWVDLLLEDINHHMKTRALKETQRNIEYLEKQFENTSYAELRAVFSELIQEEHKNKMLAQVSDEYIFKTISKAKAPEERYKPNRVLIAVVGTLLGGFLSLFCVLLLGLTRYKE